MDFPLKKYKIIKGESFVREGNEQKLERLLKDYKQRYDIDINQEFYVTQLIKLKIQYENTPEEHIKAKSDLMRLILELDRNLNLRERIKIDKYFDDYKIIIATDQTSDIYDVLMNGLFPRESNLIEFKSEKNSSFTISLLTGITIEVIKISAKLDGQPNIDKYRGIRCNKYINLTNNHEVEEWLKTTVVSYKH